MAQSRILFVHNHSARFVQIDLALLRERYDVHEWYQRSRIVNVPALLSEISKSNLVFGWFASWHTFFPVLLARMFNRPAVLVVGGYDTANLPEISYGHQRGGIRKWIARMTIKSATSLITNSDCMRDEVARNVGVDARRVNVIYHGLDDREFVPNRAKEDLVLTVGNVDWSNLQRKGLEPFVRAAAFLPEIPFEVVGAWKDDSISYLRSIASPNVHFTGRVSDDDLRNYYGRARVYVQASRHEGFGLSVAEAMLCECVPVVSKIGALPEVVGEAGVYVDSQEPQALAGAVQYALSQDRGLGQQSRERIIREFPLERRRRALYGLVERVLCGEKR